MPLMFLPFDWKKVNSIILCRHKFLEGSNITHSMFNVICRYFSFSCLHRHHNIHCWRLLVTIITDTNVFHTLFCYECFYNLYHVINDYCFIYKLSLLWVNLSFSFEIQYNDSSKQFGLIIVLNLELSISRVWEKSFFIVDSYV